MAYDGFMVSASVKEFRKYLCGGKLSKIIQPERDEIQLLIRRQKESFRLQISVNPSLPLCCITEEGKPAPAIAPGFCMSLRKQIGNGTIVSIHQPGKSLSEEGLERIIVLEIECFDELGDRVRRYLVTELMGKYSNLILLREDLTILDAIRRISASQSSVREVLPNRSYFIPSQAGKENPLSLTENRLSELLLREELPLYQALYRSLTGFSPLSSQELCFRADLDPDLPASEQGKEKLSLLYQKLREALTQAPDPCLLYQGRGRDSEAKDFSALYLFSYEGRASDPEKDPAPGEESFRLERVESVSALIRRFYSEKDRQSRIRQKSGDLRKLLTTLLERSAKKLSLQEKQLKDTEGRERYRVYGELLHTYGYSLKGGETELRCENFYDGKEISVPLRSDLTASENAQRYFEKYDKQKRTEQKLSAQLQESRNELLHLQSILSALELSEGEAELQEIRQEMEDYGFLRKSPGKKKLRESEKAKPLRFLSSDGYELYVGRNNYQNEKLSFQLADGGDLWFHVKNSPGSHVIARTGGKPLEELPDRLFLEAASLAAFYSSRRKEQKVEVDYTFRKELKRVPGAAPGFVIYHSNYSLSVMPERKLEELSS